jgi:hypothetical protein
MEKVSVELFGMMKNIISTGDGSNSEKNVLVL